jgi:hypothetical protein
MDRAEAWFRLLLRCRSGRSSASRCSAGIGEMSLRA